MSRLGSRSNCQGKGWASLVVCKTAEEVRSARAWATYVTGTSKQELHLDAPTSWDGPGMLGRDTLTKDYLNPDDSSDEDSVDAIAPMDSALWTSGQIQPPLGEWRAVQGCLHSYAPGMR